MAPMTVLPVILCGGSGTRLWPLSRRDVPKQFVVSKDNKTLFQRTYERAESHPAVRDVICICNTAQRFLVDSALEHTGWKGPLILEPVPRNTAASIASTALLVAEKDPTAILVCIPSDQDIGNIKAFHAAVTQSVAVARKGWLTIMGVAPREASTSFGYILPGESIGDGARRVRCFAEKPNVDDAQRYVSDGYLWNSGMVIARADVLIAALDKCVPQILKACRAAIQGAQRVSKDIFLDAAPFASCEAISFDHAVLEREKDLAIVDFDEDWNDVGSWPEFAKLYEADLEKNRLIGQVAAKSCRNTLIYSPVRLTVALGLRDCIVVDTPDALLVAERSMITELKNTVAELDAAGKEEVVRHKRVVRPWGYFEVMAVGLGFQVKRIAVLPSAALSLQYHNYRSEHWVVVRGVATVTCDEQKFELKSKESTYIPLKSVHRLENLGTELLEVVEVQYGNYLGEDDIVRLDDQYGRA
jgi:mannose-1-phosphate guanylyltransferase / mannose-6-phosphate isomerase